MNQSATATQPLESKAAGKGKKGAQQDENVPQEQQQKKLDDAQLQDLVQKKILEIQQQSGLPNDQDLKRISKKFQRFTALCTQISESSALSDSEKTNAIAQSYLLVIEQTITQEEKLYLLRKYLQYVSDQKINLQAENQIQAKQKKEYELLCKEFQKETHKLQENNKKMIEEEEKKRAEISENFNKSLEEIQGKIQTQDQEGQAVEKENEEMREQLKQKIQEYENRDKEFREILSQKDSEVKGKSEEFLEKIKGIEKEAKAALEFRTQLEDLRRQETEKKLRIMISDRKCQDFSDTIEKTQEMLIKFKEQVLYLAHKKKQLEEQNQQLQQCTDRSDASFVRLNQQILDEKNELEKTRREKEKLKQQILDVQNKIKAATPKK